LIDMVEATPALRQPWDVAQIWTPRAAPHLRPLQALVWSLVDAKDRPAAARRCALLSATRGNLFREEAKPFIHAAVDHARHQQAPDRAQIERFISGQIAMARRDHRLSVADAVACGFAVSPAVSYVLFQEPGSVVRFAVPERAHGAACGASPARLALTACTTDGLRFADRAVPAFSGCVQLHDIEVQ
ncbi:MAG TPA: hypothetical protein VFT05_08595, partial [Burkholderiaceae bacterium]|nr:hypothetical protein [Burkholderiaceae bacterium]